MPDVSDNTPGEHINVAVITLDGPSGSGKGSVALRLANYYGFHVLDSGAVYRVAALHSLRGGVDLSNAESVADGLNSMQASFKTAEQGVQVWLGDENVTDEIRSEYTAAAASAIAAAPAVRSALLEIQRDFRKPPGLVADGRDMGTVVFPDAAYKLFLTASAEERAQRRYKQLKEKGITVTLDSLLQEIQRRDERDASRAVAPLKAADDALVVDSTGINIDQVVDIITRSIGPEP